MKNPEKTAKIIDPASASGDSYTGVSYGNDKDCMQCGKRHPLYETQIVYEVCRNIIKLMLEQTPLPPAMMIGVLRSNNDTFFAACSPADGMPGQIAFANAIQVGRYKLPPITLVGNLPARGTISRGGRVVSAQDIRNCTVAGQPIAGRCAAPKLIHIATQQAAPRPWRLSEVWFDPALKSAAYRHLDTAESCQTCSKLIPLLLCKQVPDVDLISFTGLIRAQWTGY